MRIIIEILDAKGGVVTRSVEVPDLEPQLGQGTKNDQETQDAGSPARDAGAGAWDAGPAPTLSKLLAGLPQSASGQPGEESAPVAAQLAAQPPEQFRAEVFGIESGKGGRDAGPAPRRNTPVITSSMPSFGIAGAETGSTAASARDAGTAPRPRKRRAKK